MTSNNDTDRFNGNDPYESIKNIADKKDRTETQVMANTLENVDLNLLHKIAGKEQVYESHKTKRDYHKELADLGYFFGPTIHDNQLYTRKGGVTQYAEVPNR
ncbi:hypothetical protein [Halorubrum cibi]|uniref:Uncharacterized protein n=1 Tax=Halorubrum cibi TaxID=413815 RepID=A0A521DPN1_9EURY|nr:hypothetical protein [Halorubrum cibi]SMO73535.1 hypothetical protein SAMN06264867_107187 [Halorubrum cibi]